MKNRDEMALDILVAMIRSAPVVDRTQINERVWAEKAYRWADVMREVGGQPKLR